MVLHDFPSMASDVNTRRRAEEPVGDAETVIETADFIQLNQFTCLILLISTLTQDFLHLFINLLKSGESHVYYRYYKRMSCST